MKTLTTGFLKKCMFLLGLSMLTTLSFGQIKLSQPMSPGGTFGLIDANELKGGLMMVDSLELRDSIFMYRAKKGMMVVVADAEASAGYQTKTYMFLPSEDPADYADAGKIWNTYDEYQVHTIAQFTAKYGLDPWVEVSLGLKDPDGPGIDSLYVASAFVDTIFSNTGDTIFLVDKAKTDSLYTNYLNLSGVQVLGISSDNTFSNASNDSLATQLAVKDYIQSELSALSSNANITKLSVDTLSADTAYVIVGRIDTLMSEVAGITHLTSMSGSIDSLNISYLVFDNDTILGISKDINLGDINSSNDSISTQLAVKTYVDNKFTDFGTNASIANLKVDTLTVDTAFISSLLNNSIISESINVDTLIGLYSSMDTAAISKISADYFTLNGYWLGSVSNDTTFNAADSLALITEFGVQNRIDSVMVYVNNQFSNLSQNSIQNPVNATTKIIVNESDSLVFTVNGDTALVVNPDGSVVADTLLVNMFALSGDTIKGISTDVNMGGLDASNDSIATQLAVKSYVDTEVAKLAGSTTTDTLRASVAYIEQGNIDTLVADTAFISELSVDSLLATRIKVDTLIIPGDTIIDVAQTGDVVAVEDEENTLVTAGYVKNNASAFDEGLNPITRAGWTGVSGQNLNSDNVVEFLKKVFFPVPEPVITDFRYSASRRSYETAPVDDINGAVTETVSTRLDVPYSTWKSSAYTLGFTYSVENRSTNPGITPTEITSVGLTSSPGSTNLSTPVNNTNDISGATFTVNKADFGSPSATANNDYTFTLTVNDAYPNVNTLTFPVRLEAGNKLTVNWFRINGGSGPITVEGDGTDKTPALTWSINAQEDTITGINILQELPSAVSIPTGSTSATGTHNQTITAPASQGTYTYRYDLQVGSEVFGNNVTTNNNRTYIITDRHFWGYIDLANRNTISGLTNGDALDLNSIFNVTNGDALNKDWEGSQPNAGIKTGASSSNGILFTTSAAGDVYACIAIPKTSGSVELHQWDDLNSYWVKQDGLVVRSVKHTVGSLVKDYWIVYSTTAYSNTAGPTFRVVEK